MPRIVDAMNRAAGRPLDSDDTADLAQHTITEILAHLPQFPPDGILDRWVFCFCRNSFLNRVRRHWRHAATPLDAVAEPSQLDPSRDEMLDIALFHEAFALLSADERALIEAKNLDDLTFDEIARRWNIPASTLKTRHGVAMDRLRRRLGPKFGHNPGERPGNHGDVRGEDSA
ncbi:MAG: sigma-70 family RNA polymerase sigma factor [Planctomycetes bacterium]|nr:sigma-70 family RNA polymerase sigma factor [Planctomycetota bacterium]